MDEIVVLIEAICVPVGAAPCRSWCDEGAVCLAVCDRVVAFSRCGLAVPIGLQRLKLNTYSSNR